MTATAWGAIVYGGWLLLLLALELAALLAPAPWPTLSSFAWGLERWSTAVQVLLLLGGIVLVTHIVFRWP